MAIRRVSIIVPMYNEAAHLEHLVDDIASQDFDGDLEVFVADGRSTDGSAELLARVAAERNLELTVIDNPSRWVSPGLNACIARASGELIVRLDCHSRYPRDYVRLTVAAAHETGAWGIGALAEPEGRTPTERAIACALDSPFGGVHWTRHGSSTQRVEVDNFYLGAYRPETFAAVGGFDETLVRNQDDELNLRIRRAGGSIVLDPSVRASLTPRGSLRAAFRQYYQYGIWKVPVMRKHRQVLSARSLAPISLVASLALLAAGSTLSATARRLLALEVGAYAVGAVGFGLESVLRRREPAGLLPRVVAAFPTIHLAYGLGMARSLISPPRAGSDRAPDERPAADAGNGRPPA